MKTKILCISDSDKHFKDAISEYTKRLGSSCEIINIKPVKHGTPSQIIQKETQKIIDTLEKRKKTWEKVILLTRQGKENTTEEFAAISWPSLYVIGGPYGLDEKKLLPYVDHQISFGKQTMPHGLVKLVLLEQIYRASTLRSGKKYHY